MSLLRAAPAGAPLGTNAPAAPDPSAPLRCGSAGTTVHHLHQLGLFGIRLLAEPERPQTAEAGVVVWLDPTPDGRHVGELSRLQQRRQDALPVSLAAAGP